MHGITYLLQNPSSILWRSVVSLVGRQDDITPKMLNKITTLSRFIPRVRNARCMGGVPANFKPLNQVCLETKSHMNFMPVPQGSWQAAHSAKNSKYNMLLLGSIASVIATFTTLYATDCIYLHGPPPRYCNCEFVPKVASE